LTRYSCQYVFLKRGKDGHNLKADCKVKTTSHHQSKTTKHSQTTLRVSDCKLQTNATGWLMIHGTDFYRMSLE